MKQKNVDLRQLAMQVMQERGLQPKFADEVYIQLNNIKIPADPAPDCQDLRSLLWCSIDNEDSLDLDQLTFAQEQEGGKTTLWIAVADVSSLVPKDSPIDLHAQINTTSVYTPAQIFPMLPEKLSTDLTSLNEGKDRLAIVVKVEMTSEGELRDPEIFEAMVRNHAKLAYPSLGAWLEGNAEIPEKVQGIPGLEQALLCQHRTAQTLKKRRHLLGALTLESPEVEAKVFGKEVVLHPSSHNFADELIEHFMIAANFVMASLLRKARIPSLRRVVRVPKRWDRIRQVAAFWNYSLPEEPNSRALEEFLILRRAKDPVSFPDLSLTVIKLLGRGEYVVETEESQMVGHFGLALREYIHSTAPNRRFPDLITQRQYKAFLRGSKPPYALEELRALAAHCTQQEDAATKVERHLNKSAAALFLKDQVGTIFDGIITGASEVGTWVRIFDPPVEGKVIRGQKGLDVGDRIHVKLVSVDVSRGYINFSSQRVRHR